MNQFTAAIACSALAAIAWAAPCARAEHAVLTGATVARDATIYSESPTFNNGGGATGRAGRTGMSALRRMLVRFDFSSIPEGSTVTQVVLQMTLTNVSAGVTAPSTHTLHRLTNSWTEGTGTATNGQLVAGAVSWNSRQQGTASWAAEGGDFLPDPHAIGAAGTVVGEVVAWSAPELVADAQGWVRNPGSNNGWIVLGDEETSQSVRGFATREAASGKPVLIVDYLPGAVSAAGHWELYQ